MDSDLSTYNVFTFLSGRSYNKYLRDIDDDKCVVVSVTKMFKCTQYSFYKLYLCFHNF